MAVLWCIANYLAHKSTESTTTVIHVGVVNNTGCLRSRINSSPGTLTWALQLTSHCSISHPPQPRELYLDHTGYIILNYAGTVNETIKNTIPPFCSEVWMWAVCFKLFPPAGNMEMTNTGALRRMAVHL